MRNHIITSSVNNDQFKYMYVLIVSSHCKHNYVTMEKNVNMSVSMIYDIILNIIGKDSIKEDKIAFLATYCY